MNDPNVEMLLRLGLALAIGLLIGLERGWRQRDLPEGERVAGFRTFGLVALLGAVSAIVSPGDPWMIAAGMLAVGVLAAIGYYRTSERESGRGVTGMVALVLTFALGSMAGRGHLEGSASAAVIATLVLGFKPELHEAVRRIARQELLGTIRLLLISVVILPALPDRGFGPWQALNPYRIWWMVVLVAGVSYVGYFAKRIWGRRRGVLLAAMFGGLVSSTVVTLTLSRRAAAERQIHDTLASGIVVACSMMFLRLLAILAPIAPAMLGALAPPLVAAAAVGFVAAGLLAVRARKEKSGAEEPEMELRNPFDLATALEFGAVLAGILVLSRALDDWLGASGLYAMAAIGGLADVDAIALSVASLSYQEGAATVAIASVLIAAGVNTIVKAAIAIVLGGWRFGWRVVVPMTLSLAIGALALWAIPTR